MLNDIKSFFSVKNSIVQLGANKLANILIFLIISFVVVNNYKDEVKIYLENMVREQIEQAVKNASDKTSGEINEVKYQVSILNDSLSAFNERQKKVQKLNYITLDAVLEQKTKLEILEELYKSGMNGWGMTPVKKKSSSGPTLLNLANKENIR